MDTEVLQLVLLGPTIFFSVNRVWVEPTFFLLSTTREREAAARYIPFPRGTAAVAVTRSSS